MKYKTDAHWMIHRELSRADMIYQYYLLSGYYLVSTICSRPCLIKPPHATSTHCARTIANSSSLANLLGSPSACVKTKHTARFKPQVFPSQVRSILSFYYLTISSSMHPISEYEPPESRGLFPGGILSSIIFNLSKSHKSLFFSQASRRV